MRHELTIEGFAFRLRPVRDSDTDFIVKLRTNPNLNRYINSGTLDAHKQLQWLSAYYQRDGDYYFVVEKKTDKTPEGLISIYDVDKRFKVAEWGRWILKPNSLASTESAYLIYLCAFEVLLLEKLYCRTAKKNQQVVSFHDSCGATEKKTIEKYNTLNGIEEDFFEHVVSMSDWPRLKEKLGKISHMLARKLLK